MKMLTAAFRAAFLCLGLMAATLALSACGSTADSNVQTRAGIADAELATALGPDGVPYISAMRLIDGKERGDVTLEIETPSGHKVLYTASDVRAFSGQEFRAGLEEKIAEAYRDATPEVVTSIASAVIKYLVP
jgi:hypothetical protein